MKKIYRALCKFEEIAASAMLVIITLLVFLSAVGRALRFPLNWAQDISLLLFAWVVFFGADTALRDADFVNVDMFLSMLPKKVREILYYFWNTLIVLFLGSLAVYGIPLSIENSKRLFQTLGISYSWATISVPVGAVLMIITVIIRMVNRYKSEDSMNEEVKA
ncbi:TRAP transporter small permease [Proteiniclasticum sp. C24MP]|uniref:TRAP transporter small permease n=1 Tax=Proteiniclasticum sp. C24MP TaxID=3374101 RepID=UPI0037547EAB